MIFGVPLGAPAALTRNMCSTAGLYRGLVEATSDDDLRNTLVVNEDQIADFLEEVK